MIDTLKTTAAGTGGFIVTCIEWLPDVVRVLVGIVTIVYMVVKVKNELSR